MLFLFFQFGHSSVFRIAMPTNPWHVFTATRFQCGVLRRRALGVFGACGGMHVGVLFWNPIVCVDGVVAQSKTFMECRQCEKHENRLPIRGAVQTIRTKILVFRSGKVLFVGRAVVMATHHNISCFHPCFPSFCLFSPRLQIVILTKMVMTGMIVIIEPGSPVQMVVAILVMETYLLIVLKTSPFISDADDVSVFVSSLALVLTTLGGLVLFLDPEELFFHRKAIGVGIIAMNVSVLVLQFSVLIFIKCGLEEGVSSTLKVIRRTSVLPVVVDGEDTEFASVKNWGRSPQ